MASSRQGQVPAVVWAGLISRVFWEMGARIKSQKGRVAAARHKGDSS